MTAAPALRAPTTGQLHLWPFSLDRAGAEPDALSREERARAARFRFARDAQRFVAGRAAMRSVLARYCAVPAGELELVVGEQGKPALADAVARQLWFNLAHSAEQALLVVAADELVGVDVEHVRPGFADDEIAERFFAPREVEALRALPLDAQQDAFFRCWTRKEAYIKARGGGLHIPLDSFTVAFTPGKTPALTWVADDAPGTEAAAWTMLDVSDATPASVAAVAVRVASERVELPALFDLHG